MISLYLLARALQHFLMFWREICSEITKNLQKELPHDVVSDCPDLLKRSITRGKMYSHVETKGQ